MGNTGFQFKEEGTHTTHPINKCIRLINSFSIEAFIKLQNSSDKTQVPDAQMKLINQLAKHFDIQVPRNTDIKSTSFLRMSKEKMQVKLFRVLNKSNNIELDFKREKFQHYKGFIGRGNNSSLLF